jgi:hypothetical protein
MNKKIKWAMQFVFAIAGITLIWRFSNGWVAFGIFLVMWADNIDKNKGFP